MAAAANSPAAVALSKSASPMSFGESVLPAIPDPITSAASKRGAEELGEQPAGEGRGTVTASRQSKD